MAAESIRTFLDLSTAHLAPATRRVMDAWCATIDRGRSRVSKCPTLMGMTDHGWIVFATEDTTRLPRDLAQCIEYARNEDCAYILFDGDAPTDDNLPTFEEDGSP